MPAGTQFLAGVDLELEKMRQHWSALVRGIVFAGNHVR